MPYKIVPRTRTVVEEYQVPVLEFSDTEALYRDKYDNAKIEVRPTFPNEVADGQSGYAFELNVWDPDINDDTRVTVRAFFSRDDLMTFAEELFLYGRKEQRDSALIAEGEDGTNVLVDGQHRLEATRRDG